MTENQVVAVEAMKALVSEGFAVPCEVYARYARIEADSLVYAEDIIHELNLQVGQRVDNVFDNHILYLDNHNKAVAKYNYDTGILLLSNKHNHDAFAEYCMNVQHDGLEVFENPLSILHLLAQIKA